MGLGDFIFLIDKLGWWGIVLVILFCLVQFIGSIVDIYQFLDFQKKLRRKKKFSAKASANISKP